MPAPFAPHRVAAIDIGSNAARLEIAARAPDGSLATLAEDRVFTRLGQNIASGGPLPQSGIDAALAAVSRFRDLARTHRVDAVRAVATAAAREAPNGPAFLARASRLLGAPVRVIPPAEECLLAFRSAAAAFPLADHHSLVIDVGGGTIQFTRAVHALPYDAQALPLGAVRLTSMFGGPEAVTRPRNARDLQRHVARVLKDFLERSPAPITLATGSGGTLTTLGLLSASLERPAGRVGRRDASISRTDLERVIALIAKTPFAARSSLPGMLPDRVDIIPAGLLALAAILDYFQIPTIKPHAGGVKHGLVLAMLADLDQPAPTPDSPALHADQLLAQSRTEIPHARHVAALSLQLFDQLICLPALRRRLAALAAPRTLLHAAALLHDVGVAVEYRRHHKHSARMIRLAEFPGLSTPDRECVALIARYHRKAEPSADHADFAALRPRQREAVRTLAGILRVADGHDRTHNAAITSLTCTPAPRRPVSIIATASPTATAADLKACRRAAQRKATLLESVLGIRLEFPPAVAPSTPARPAARSRR